MTELVPIPGFAGYFADQDGTIWSTKARKRGVGNRVGWHDNGPPRPLATHQEHDGYLTVVVRADDGRKRTMRVATLVARAFHGPRPKDFVVAHLNGLRADDRTVNVAYVSQSENMAHRHAHGTAPTGERANRAKLTEAQAREVLERVGRGEAGASIARAMGITEGAVCSIKMGRTWPHLPRPLALIPNWPAGMSAGLVM